MSPRRVLIVSFSYWPMANARAFRWTALAEDWARRGLEVNVICAWLPGRPRHEEVNGVRIHRAGSGLVERIRAMLAARRGEVAVPDPATPRERPRRGLAFSLAAFLNERVWRKLYRPLIHPAFGSFRAGARPGRPARRPAGRPTDQGLLGKLSFPIEVVLDARRGARLTFDAGLKLHELKFGGAQLALSVPL